ncbi:MAG TPA: DUF3052 family protein [Candidatus Saccharimonadia bacterium]|nr:DUF3052 family protein [Candidatus Saccharimonadia bacterium]
MLDKKLQLKPGQTVAQVNSPVQLPLDAMPAAPEAADAVIVFTANGAELQQSLSALKTAVGEGKLTWVAYPKAGQLGTDINRDIIRDIANQNGLDPVRQIALDEVWSALRLKAL